MGARRRDEAGAPPGAPPPHLPQARSTELTRLVQQASSTDEIRQDVVDAARQRVGSGEYMTQDAAAKTIDAVLREHV